MSRLQQYINELQNKPLNVRLRILWSTTAAVAVILIAVWAVTIKSELAINPEVLAENANPESTMEYIEIERAEFTGTLLNLYFKASNDTTDILNFSKPESIELTANGQTINPVKIVDRQGRTFVQKILSNSENYGILIFNIADAGEGEIVFDDLYFESRPEGIFKETAELDFDKLKKEQEIRR
jgi:hypothetical protein